MKMLRSLGSRWVAGFAESKKPVRSLKNYLKSKQMEDKIDIE
jgi:hypothetical protein